MTTAWTFTWRGNRRTFYPSEAWTHSLDPACPNSLRRMPLVEALGCEHCGRHPPEVRRAP